MSDKSGQTPTYIAQCPECECLIGCAVAEVNRPETMREALKAQGQWVRARLRVSTVTVQDVRTWPSEKAFEHSDGCSRNKRKKKQATFL